MSGERKIDARHVAYAASLVKGGPRRAVLNALAYKSTWATGGESRPSIPTLMDLTGLSRNAVMGALDSLQGDGIIEHTGDWTGHDGGRPVKEWRLRLDLLASKWTPPKVQHTDVRPIPNVPETTSQRPAPGHNQTVTRPNDQTLSGGGRPLSSSLGPRFRRDQRREGFTEDDLMAAARKELGRENITPGLPVDDGLYERIWKRLDSDRDATEQARLLAPLTDALSARHLPTFVGDLARSLVRKGTVPVEVMAEAVNDGCRLGHVLNEHADDLGHWGGRDDRLAEAAAHVGCAHFGGDWLLRLAENTASWEVAR